MHGGENFQVWLIKGMPVFNGKLLDGGNRDIRHILPRYLSALGFLGVQLPHVLRGHFLAQAAQRHALGHTDKFIAFGKAKDLPYIVRVVADINFLALIRK